MPEMRADRWGLTKPYGRALILLGMPHFVAILGDPGSERGGSKNEESLPSIRVAKMATQLAGRWPRSPHYPQQALAAYLD